MSAGETTTPASCLPRTGGPRTVIAGQLKTGHVQNSGSRSRFEAIGVDDVVFSNDPDFSPSRRGPCAGRLVDSVTFTGRGEWNGKSGYTFEATATDQGEPGKAHDTFSFIVRDGKGSVVANVGGVLGGGNVESSRSRRARSH
jgi:hypothetical protein